MTSVLKECGTGAAQVIDHKVVTGVATTMITYTQVTVCSIIECAVERNLENIQVCQTEFFASVRRR